MIRFIIFEGWDDAGLPTWDELDVDRKEAASILRRQHREGAYIERRKPRPGSFELAALGHFYIEPKEFTG